MKAVDWNLADLTDDAPLVAEIELAVSDLNDRIRLARSRGLHVSIKTDTMRVTPSGVTEEPVSVAVLRPIDGK
jgi:hypothetical protein